MTQKTKSLILIPILLTGVVLATIACTSNRFQQTSARTVEPKSVEILTNGDFSAGASKWVLEEAGAKGKAEFVKEGPDGSSAMKLTVLSVGDQSWRLQTYQPNLKISKKQEIQLDLLGEGKARNCDNGQLYAKPRAMGTPRGGSRNADHNRMDSKDICV